MLGSNDISNDAKSNGHANVTDLTLDKAHRGRYMLPSFTKKVGTNLMSIIVLGTGSSDGDDISVCENFSFEQHHLLVDRPL